LVIISAAKRRSLPAMPSASAVQEIVHRDLAVDGGEHGRAARWGAAPAPGVFADAIFVGQLDVTLCERMKHHFRRH
jgi:hypothetical protein